MSKRWLYKVLGAGALTFVVSAANAQYAAPDEILVKYRSGAVPASRAQVASAVMGRVLGSEPKLNCDRIQLPSAVPVSLALSLLRNDPRVEFAEPNYVVKIFAAPNDPLYSTSQYAPQLTQANLAWDKWSPKAEVVVAIVDTGVLMTHEDLTNKMFRQNGSVVGYDCQNGDSDPTDDNGHGTHCAGIAAAEANNAKGVAGVGGWSVEGNAYAVKVMPVKVMDASGSGYMSTVAQGVIWATDHGANVISMSLGSSSNSSTLASAINYAYSKGVTVVAAAGNNASTTPSYPGANNHVLSVASTDQNDGMSSFSNYGSWVLTAAPGSGIMSTLKSGGYGYMSGTSMATPFVAGEAAFLKAQDPTLTPDQIVSLITKNVDSINPASGRTIAAGAGRVNVLKALNSLINQEPSPRLSTAAYTASSIEGGVTATLRLTLDAVAPAEGVTVNLASSSSSVTPPATANFPAGVSSITVSVPTAAVNTSMDTITNVTYGGDTLRAPLTLTPAAAKLSSITLTPSSVLGGAVSVLKVQLTGNAPSGGSTVQLSSNNEALTVPSTVTVSAGSSSASVNVSTVPVSANVTATVTATMGSDSKTASLFITAPTLSSVSLNPTSVQGGGGSVITLQLNGAAPSGGLTVLLTSNNQAMSLPASVSVAAGASSATAAVSTSSVMASVTATATATLGTGSKTASLTITPAPLPKLASVAFNPTSVQGGTSSMLTVRLSAVAPEGGVAVKLVSGSALLGLPASVSVPAGFDSASVSVSTSAVATSTVVSATATLGTNSLKASLTLTQAPLPTLVSASFTPSTVVGGKSASLFLQLSGPVPTGGMTVTLSSSTGSMKLPSSIKIAAGASSATVTATTNTVNTPLTAIATAKAASGSVSASLSISATPKLTGARFTSTSLVGGNDVTLHLELSVVAPAGGTTISITPSNKSMLSTPSTVTFNEGTKSMDVTCSTSTVAKPYNLYATAKLGTSSLKANLTVTQAVPTLVSVTIPANMVSNRQYAGTVLLSGNALPSGMVVTLTGEGGLTIPASVKIASGSRKGSFTFRSPKVSLSTAVSVTASANGQQVRAEAIASMTGK